MFPFQETVFSQPERSKPSKAFVLSKSKSNVPVVSESSGRSCEGEKGMHTSKALLGTGGGPGVGMLGVTPDMDGE